MYFSNKIFNFPIQTLISFKVDLLNLQAQGGGCTPSLPCFLPFTPNIFRQPIPENSCKPFCCRIKKNSFTPSQSTLQNRSKNRQCSEGLRKSNGVLCAIFKQLVQEAVNANPFHFTIHIHFPRWRINNYNDRENFISKSYIPRNWFCGRYPSLHPAQSILARGITGRNTYIF